MKSKNTLPTEFKFTKIVAQDKNDDHEVHYKEFPGVVGYGKTEQEAELSLIQTLVGMLNERGEKIREQSLNKYYKH
jgi:predicted RNase H-like HicB family nuclease